jgi:DNA-binding response OmpR family regulator
MMNKVNSERYRLKNDRAQVSIWGSTLTHQPTILICDDEQLLRLDIGDHLREEGYRIIEAKDADRAKALFMSGLRIDMLSLDLIMPGKMNGLELADWVRKTYPQTRIIVLTGRPRRDSAARNFDDFVMKPYDLDDLTRRIRALVPFPS